jgi:transposase-like protein
MKETRRRFSAAFKAKVAIEALQERKTMAEITQQYGIHANMIKRWKQEFISRSTEIFETKAATNDFEAEREKLYAKIGQLEMEKQWLKKISGRAGV